MKVRDINIESIIEIINNIVKDFEWNDRIRRIGVFGSLARGEASEDSDIDFIVDYEYKYSSNDEIINEVKRQFQLDEILRNVFSPIELSIVTLQAIEDEHDIEFKIAIERDVVWVYE